MEKYTMKGRFLGVLHNGMTKNGNTKKIMLWESSHNLEYANVRGGVLQDIDVLKMYDNIRIVFKVNKDNTRRDVVSVQRQPLLSVNDKFTEFYGDAYEVLEKSIKIIKDLGFNIESLELWRLNNVLLSAENNAAIQKELEIPLSWLGGLYNRFGYITYNMIFWAMRDIAKKIVMLYGYGMDAKKWHAVAIALVNDNFDIVKEYRD